MIRKFVLFLFCLATLAAADPQLVMSTQDPKVLKARISQLKELQNSNQLSDTERERLDQLWQDAAIIEMMNDRCGTISITEVLDESCGNFYQKELPKFEAEFFKLTGEIRLSRSRLSNAIEQRRQAIQQCYDALQIEAFYPSRYFSLEGKYTPEPLSNGVEVSYNFHLEWKDDAFNELNDRLEEWNRVCGDIVHHSDNSGELAPIFSELITNSISQANTVNGGLYFELGRGDSEIRVKTKKGLEGVYYLNRRELFNYKISEDSQIFSIRFDSSSPSINFIEGNRWRDKVIFKDSDLRDGLMGRFVWGPLREEEVEEEEYVAPVPAILSAPAPTIISAPKAEYVSYNDSWDSSESSSTPTATSTESSTNENAETGSNQSTYGIDFGLQVLGGINLSFGEASSSKPFKDYAGEEDSITAVTGYVSGLFYLEFSRNFAIAAGGGIAWNTVNYQDCSSYYTTECDEENIHFETSPIFTAELNFGDGLNGGFRFHYVFDSELPTYYLGAFLELGNLIGMELGWVHTDNLWDNIYVGLTLRIPPRHFSDRINQKK